jgi:hypothetical protein
MEMCDGVEGAVSPCAERERRRPGVDRRGRGKLNTTPLAVCGQARREVARSAAQRKRTQARTGVMRT